MEESDGLKSNEESKQSRALKVRDEENTENTFFFLLQAYILLHVQKF